MSLVQVENIRSCTCLRPVSLTCATTISKVMEHILTNHLMTHAEENTSSNPNQHRFRRCHGGERQLTELICDIAASLNQVRGDEACVLDFSKASNKVNRKKLLYKFTWYIVSYQLIAWIDDFLTSRTQSVVIDAKESSETSLSSDVPQGSVIGPAKFLFYVNDLPDNSRTFIRFFADDTIAYNSACNHSTPQ